MNTSEHCQSSTGTCAGAACAVLLVIVIPAKLGHGSAGYSSWSVLYDYRRILIANCSFPFWIKIVNKFFLKIPAYFGKSAFLTLWLQTASGLLERGISILENTNICNQFPTVVTFIGTNVLLLKPGLIFYPSLSKTKFHYRILEDHLCLLFKWINLFSFCNT